MKAEDEEGNEMEITYSQKLQKKILRKLNATAQIQENTMRTLQFIALILTIFVAMLMYVVFKLDQINAISALIGG